MQVSSQQEIKSKVKPFSKFTLFPQQITQKVNLELWNFQKSGFSYFQLSHRSKYYADVNNSAITLLRQYFSVPQSHKVLFMVTDSVQSSFMYNLLSQKPHSCTKQVNYIVNGKRSQKAVSEARKFNNQDFVISQYSSAQQRGRKSIYTHYNIVEPNQGKQNPEIQPFEGQILVCDISFSAIYKKINIGKHGIVYLDSQTGFSLPGVTIVFVDEKLIGKQTKDCPDMLNYALTFKMNSIINTPNTLTILLLKEKLEFWLKNNITQESNQKELKKGNNNMKKMIMQKYSGVVKEVIENDGYGKNPVNLLGFKMNMDKNQQQIFEQFLRNSYVQTNCQQTICWVLMQLQNIIN